MRPHFLSTKIGLFFMKKRSLLLPAFAVLLLSLSSFRPSNPSLVEVKWYTWDEAVALNKVKPKKFMVDVYTDWCGWCKVMDKKTFTDEAVAKFIGHNFYPIKFNAEQKDDVKFNGQTYKYVETNGGRGIHTLAYALLDGKMGYPTVVYLNEKYERILISPGYKEPADMTKELRFIAEQQYLKTTWEAYRDGK